MWKPEKGPQVTTSELTATNAAERNALTHLAADARMLTHNSHPGLVPVVEARWLAANRLSISRANVQGATLRQTLDAAGPIQESRVVEILNDVGAVLDWAARGNITHRHVSSDSVCFQKGSDRTLMSLGPSMNLDAGRPVSGVDSPVPVERCADGATLARLAYEMLTAHRAGDASVESLRAVRPDVSDNMVTAIEAGLNCATDARPLGASQFLAQLAGGGAPIAGAAAIATAALPPAVPREARQPVPQPVRSLETQLAAPRRKRGRGLVVAGMLALVILIGSTFALIQRDRDSRDEARVATVDRDDEAAGEAAGDVAAVDTMGLPPDPGGLTTDDNAPVQPAVPIQPGLPPSLPSNLPEPLPDTLAPAPEPLESPTQPLTVCATPTMGAQRTCLAGMITSSDAELTSVYQALLRAVEDRDGEVAVESVRADQRAWLGQRDGACDSPAAVEGALWARERGDCFARQSDARALELARALAAVRSAPRP